MFEAVVAGATDPDITGVDVVRRAALAVTASDFDADGYVPARRRISASAER